MKNVLHLLIALNLFLLISPSYAQYTGRPPNSFGETCAQGTICTDLVNQMAYCSKECRKKYGSFSGDVSRIRGEVEGMRMLCVDPQTNKPGTVCTPVNNSCMCFLLPAPTDPYSIPSGVRG